MCSIFGIISTSESPKLYRNALSLLRLSEARGSDASSIYYIGSSSTLFKQCKSPSYLARLLVKDVGPRPVSNSRLICGHSRMATNGPNDLDNLQPIVSTRFAIYHNGITTNIDQINAALENPFHDCYAQSDTKIIHQFLQTHGIDALVKSLEGSHSFSIFDFADRKLYLFTNTGTLYIGSDHHGNTYFASQYDFLSRLRCQNIDQLSSGVVYHYDIDSQFYLAPLLEHVWKKHSDNHYSISYFDIPPIKHHLVDSQKRCRCCLLPSSFPFVDLDHTQCCRLCRNHVPLKTHGSDQLIQKLSDSRILLPFSGGRDSSYALHYLTRELGLGKNLVTYTYDWGLTTDLARRNISRMCGALDIENINVSAKLDHKRLNIKRNILAWSRDPKPGVLPLLIAGDKQFFYHALRLSKSYNIDHIVYAMNPYERTDFKIGSAGIDESYDKRFHYSPKLSNLIRLLLFYANTFVANPALLNPSLIDTLTAFASYYLLPKNYISIFDYVQWSEKTIDETLITKYGWETDPSQASTWRIGDGTSPFYNYFYLKWLGFTETDCMLSNLVRDKKISRSNALDKLHQMNKINISGIHSYFKKIDVPISLLSQLVALSPY